MKKLIVANWKMNPTSQKEAKQLFDAIKKAVRGGPTSAKAEVVVCPPSVYLAQFTGLPLGAQNMFYKEKGAFTGEISPSMLKDSGVEYIIIGHSERRTHFGETDELINKKIKAALEYKLIPVVCVGEKEGEDKNQILETQLVEGLKNIPRDSIKKMVIAYEPVWAIGTGKNCSVNETMSSVLLIRKIITNLYSRQVASAVSVLYGGSVTAENSAQYLKEGGVDGLLVGGASLNAEEFLKIVKSA